MLTRFIRSIFLICLCFVFPISGQDGGEDSKYIRPHDDVGFFLPFKSFPSIEKEGNAEEYNYQPSESNGGINEKSLNAYENVNHENAPTERKEKYENKEKFKYMSSETAKEEDLVPVQHKEDIHQQYKKSLAEEVSFPKYPTNFKYQQVSQGDVAEITREDQMIHKRIENIDETLKSIDKMMKEIPSVKQDPRTEQVNAESEEKLFKKFKDNQKLLPTFPTKPEDTRRMFEHPLEKDIKRISELSLEIQFRKKHGLSSRAL